MRFRDKKVDRDWLNSNFPCMMACPAGTNAGRYVALIADGQFEEASRAVDCERRRCGTWRARARDFLAPMLDHEAQICVAINIFGRE